MLSLVVHIPTSSVSPGPVHGRLTALTKVLGKTIDDFPYYEELNEIWSGIPGFDSELISSAPNVNHSQDMLDLVVDLPVNADTVTVTNPGNLTVAGPAQAGVEAQPPVQELQEVEMQDRDSHSVEEEGNDDLPILLDELNADEEDMRIDEENWRQMNMMGLDLDDDMYNYGLDDDVGASKPVAGPSCSNKVWRESYISGYRC